MNFYVLYRKKKIYRLTSELLCSEAQVNHKEVYVQFAEQTPLH